MTCLLLSVKMGSAPLSEWTENTDGVPEEMLGGYTYTHMYIRLCMLTNAVHTCVHSHLSRRNRESPGLGTESPLSDLRQALSGGHSLPTCSLGCSSSVDQVGSNQA